MTSGNQPQIRSVRPTRVVPARPPRRAPHRRKSPGTGRAQRQARSAPRRTLRALTATILAAAVGLLSVTPALAVPDGDADGGLWYYTKTGIADLHAQGITGQGVTVAVIDGPINPTVPELQGANLTIHEPSYCQYYAQGEPTGEYRPATEQNWEARHGTEMTALIVGNGDGGGSLPGIQGLAPQAHVLFYNAVTPSMAGEFVRCIGDDDSVANAMEQAIADGAQIISVSLDLGGTMLLDAVAHAEGLGIVVVNAVSNHRNTQPFGEANGTLTLQRAGPDGQVDPDNAFSSEYIDLIAPGKDILGYTIDSQNTWSRVLGAGTSDSTAITSGVLALVMSAHPGITANQALQAVLRNTSQGNGNLVLDPSGMTGYGMLNPTAAIASDPSQYPDVNPLIIDDILARPLKADIDAWAAQAGRTQPSATPTTTAPTPTPTPTASIAATGPADTGPTSTIIWIALAAIIAAAGTTTLVIILAHTRKRATTPANTYPTLPSGRPPSGTAPHLPPPPGHWQTPRPSAGTSPGYGPTPNQPVGDAPARSMPEQDPPGTGLQ